MASSRSSRANKSPTSPIFNFTQISLHLIIFFSPRSHIFLHTPLSLSLKQISHFPSYSYVSLALSLSLAADAPRSRWSKAPMTHGRTDFSSGDFLLLISISFLPILERLFQELMWVCINYKALSH